jgi:hypothetical protein
MQVLHDAMREQSPPLAAGSFRRTHDHPAGALEGPGLESHVGIDEQHADQPSPPFTLTLT